MAGLGIDIKQLLTPMMLASVVKGEEFDISKVVDIYVNDMIVNTLLQNIQLPEEFKDLKDVIQLMLDVQRLKSISAVLKGETPTIDISKVLDLVINLNLIASLAGAFGGGATPTPTPAK